MMRRGAPHGVRFFGVPRRPTQQHTSLWGVTRCSVLVQARRHGSTASATEESWSFVGALDRWWFRESKPVAPQEAYVSWFDDVFESVQAAFGVEAWLLLMMFGGAVRLCTLYFSLYGERAAVRMQCALPSLVPAHNQFQRIYYNENASALEVQQAATILKAIRKQTYKFHHTSNLKTLAGLVASPFVLQGFYSVSKLCESFDSNVGTSSFMWCAALGMPDPLYILPVVSCCLTLLNLELTLLSRGELKKGLMGNFIWGGRMLCVCAIPAVAQFRSGVLLYWIGMSAVGLLQPILVRSASFRAWFGIPQPPPVAASGSQEEDLLQKRFVLQAPYFSHLFETDITNGTASAPPAEPAAATRRAPGYAHSRGETVPSHPTNSTRTLSEEMSSVESKSFGVSRAPSITPSTASKRGGAAFASSGWKADNPSTLSVDDLIPPHLRDDSQRK